MTGIQLKAILQSQDISGYKLAAKMGMHQRSIYGWYTADRVKKSIIEKIINKTGLERSLFFPDEKLPGPATNYDESIHHGERVAELLKEKGLRKDAFAGKMQFSRQTLFTRLKEEKWPNMEILQAAAILGVPTTEITGGDKLISYQKEIYLELTDMKNALQKIADKLNIPL